MSSTLSTKTLVLVEKLHRCIIWDVGGEGNLVCRICANVCMNKVYVRLNLITRRGLWHYSNTNTETSYLHHPSCSIPVNHNHHKPWPQCEGVSPTIQSLTSSLRKLQFSGILPIKLKTKTLPIAYCHLFEICKYGALQKINVKLTAFTVDNTYWILNLCPQNHKGDPIITFIL